MAVQQPSLSKGDLMPSIRACVQFTHITAAEFRNFDKRIIFAEPEVIARPLDWRPGIGTMLCVGAENADLEPSQED